MLTDAEFRVALKESLKGEIKKAPVEGDFFTSDMVTVTTKKGPAFLVIPYLYGSYRLGVEREGNEPQERTRVLAFAAMLLTLTENLSNGSFYLSMRDIALTHRVK